MKKRIIGILTTICLFSTVSTIALADSNSTTSQVNINYRVVNKNNIDIRIGPGANYDSLKKLDKGTKVEILSYDNGWYKVSSNNTIGYIETKYITYNEVLFLNWFDDGESLIFRDDFATNLENSFIVEDAETGLKFKMLRTGGTNHADVEPLTASDADIIKEIWEGFNWNRRPIFIHINGKVYGASMSGMPHAGLDSETTREYTDLNRSNNYGAGINYDSVKNNNVDGHLDIHLLNSKTHTTNKLDDAHQENIKKLMEIYNK
ncbi:MAG: SH3 domain-containing protein [Peptostreptococcaceae bacterium]